VATAAHVSVCSFMLLVLIFTVVCTDVLRLHQPKPLRASMHCNDSMISHTDQTESRLHRNTIAIDRDRQVCDARFVTQLIWVPDEQLVAVVQ
jgi:hypothetical protein